MSRTLLRNARILDPERREAVAGSVLLEGGRVKEVMTQPDATVGGVRVVELAGATLAPGWIDLHFHGFAALCEAPGLNDAIARDAASIVTHGTTAFLTTTVTRPMTHLAPLMTRLASCVHDAPGGGAIPIGVHLEGPWIRPEAAGAHAPGDILPFASRAGSDLLERAEGAVRMVTYAPEVDGALDLQDELARRGIVGALGHSLADADRVDPACDRGAGHVTHLFNAMGSFHHREPGLAAAVLGGERLTADLICDGVHVHPRVVRMAARAAGDRIALITDRVDPGAAGAQPPVLGGGDRLVSDRGAWRLPDGRLAGSQLQLDGALRNWMEFTGSALLDAVRACTLRPARILGIESERGTLRPGARADLVILGDDLRVRQTWVGGEPVYTAPDPA